MTRAQEPHRQSRLDTLIAERLGLRVGDSQLALLRRFVATRVAKLGLDCEDRYLDRVESNEQERSLLWSQATIGETYFFREVGHLRTALLTAAERRRPAGSPLRIWCAGCSTGEEPYSIAILAAELNLSVSILGTDVDATALATAGAAEYEAWSLRKLGTDRIERTTVAVENSAKRRLRSELRQHVRFERHNLVSPLTPGRAGEWDLICCRNVLFYLERPKADQVVARLLAALAKNGRLLLGAAEPLRPSSIALTERRSGTILYSPSESLTLGSAPDWEPSAPHRDDRERSLNESPGQSLDRPSLEAQRREASQHAIDLLSLDQGESTLGFLDSLPAKLSLCPEIQFIKAMAARSAGDATSFERILRGVLFLDPAFWPASFHLGMSCDRLGRHQEAQRSFRRALQSLDDGMKSSHADIDRSWASLQRLLPFRSDVEALCRQRLEPNHRSGS